MPKAHGATKAIQIIIIVLIIVLVVLVFFFVRQSIILHRERILSARELWISDLLKSRGAPTPADVAFVQPWMTFDYVNKLFNVPPDYLRGKLSISDPGYPHETISSYARHNGVDVGMFLADLDQALVAYLTPTTSTISHA